MAPIDPSRIRQQTNALVNQIGNPDQFARAIHQLLEQYTDYSFRQSELMAQRSPFKVHNTPKPVLRSILNSLRPYIQSEPHLGFALAQRLWQVPSHEERWLAGELLALCVPASPYVVQQQLEEWLVRLNDSNTADALGLSAGSALLSANPRQFLNVARSWLQEGNRWTKRFALAAMMGLFQKRTFVDVNAVLEVVRSLMSESDAETRTALAALLREMVVLNSTEVVRFLREWAAGMDRHAHWIVRQVLESLDLSTRNELIAMMRTPNTFSAFA